MCSRVDHFRTNVLWTPTQRARQVVFVHLLAQTEVSQLYVASEVHKHILWLQISVCNALSVQMFNRKDYLSDYQSSVTLTEALLFAQVVE